MRVRHGLVAAVGLALAACSSDSATAPAASVTRDGLTFEAASALGMAPPPTLSPPDSVPAVRTTVTVRATGSAPVTLDEGACVVQLTLHRTAGRSGTSAWDRGATENCPAALRRRTLEPGEAATYGAVARLAELRAAGLAPGRYYVTATVDLTLRGPAVVLAAGEVELPGG